MCRNITILRGLEPAAPRIEIEAAARQYVRKVGGLKAPSRHTEDAFERAARKIADATEELLAALDPDMFWRAHRSFVVNINRIREVVPWFKSSYQLRMDDKKQSEIPVSRAQTKRLRELFGL